jgi:hypothetical protein
MKKLLFGLPLLFIGCAEVHDALNTAKGELMAPPSAIMAALDQILNFLIMVGETFLTNLFGPLFLAIKAALGL